MIYKSKRLVQRLYNVQVIKGDDRRYVGHLLQILSRWLKKSACFKF